MDDLNRESETADGWWTWNKGTDNKIKATDGWQSQVGETDRRHKEQTAEIEKKVRWFPSNQLINQTEINGLRDGQEAHRIQEKKDDGEIAVQVRGDDGKRECMMCVVFLKHYGLSADTAETEWEKLKKLKKKKRAVKVYDAFATNEKQTEAIQTSKDFYPVHFMSCKVFWQILNYSMYN